MEALRLGLEAVQHPSILSKLLPEHLADCSLRGGLVPPRLRLAYTPPGLGMNELLFRLERPRLLTHQVTQPGNVLVVDVHDQPATRLEMAPDGVQASQLLLDRVQVLEGVPADDREAELLCQVKRTHIAVHPVEVRNA